MLGMAPLDPHQNWIYHLRHDYISTCTKLVARAMIHLVSKSLLLFCCCCASNEIRMSSKHINVEQMRSELNSSIPPSRIGYSLCC